jgi:D-aminopeptidase
LDVCKRPAKNLSDYGVAIGVLHAGKWNAITDVPGVEVGQKTLMQGDDVRTGVTAVLPYSGNIFQSKVPAAAYLGNGFGKLIGTTQIDELVLTNTLSVPTAADALIDYTFAFPEDGDVRSVNPVVAETNEGYLTRYSSCNAGNPHSSCAFAGSLEQISHALHAVGGKGLCQAQSTRM